MDKKEGTRIKREVNEIDKVRRNDRQGKWEKKRIGKEKSKQRKS